MDVKICIGEKERSVFFFLPSRYFYSTKSAPSGGIKLESMIGAMQRSFTHVHERRIREFLTEASTLKKNSGKLAIRCTEAEFGRLMAERAMLKEGINGMRDLDIAFEETHEQRHTPVNVDTTVYPAVLTMRASVHPGVSSIPGFMSNYTYHKAPFHMRTQPPEGTTGDLWARFPLHGGRLAEYVTQEALQPKHWGFNCAGEVREMPTSPYQYEALTASHRKAGYRAPPEHIVLPTRLVKRVEEQRFEKSLIGGGKEQTNIWGRFEVTIPKEVEEAAKEWRGEKLLFVEEVLKDGTPLKEDAWKVHFHEAHTPIRCFVNIYGEQNVRGDISVRITRPLSLRVPEAVGLCEKVTPVLMSSKHQEYAVNNGPIRALRVYDNGNSLVCAGEYKKSKAGHRCPIPNAGSFYVSPEDGTFVLGAIPAGELTVDVDARTDLEYWTDTWHEATEQLRRMGGVSDRTVICGGRQQGKTHALLQAVKEMVLGAGGPDWAVHGVPYRADLDQSTEVPSLFSSAMKVKVDEANSSTVRIYDGKEAKPGWLYTIGTDAVAYPLKTDDQQVADPEARKHFMEFKRRLKDTLVATGGRFCVPGRPHPQDRAARIQNLRMSERAVRQATQLLIDAGWKVPFFKD